MYLSTNFIVHSIWMISSLVVFMGFLKTSPLNTLFEYKTMLKKFQLLNEANEMALALKAFKHFVISENEKVNYQWFKSCLGLKNQKIS
jgi:hypothetical protein